MIGPRSRERRSELRGESRLDATTAREPRSHNTHRTRHEERSGRSDAQFWPYSIANLQTSRSKKKNDMFNPRLRLRFVGVHGGALHRFATSGFSFREIVSSYFTHSQTSFFSETSSSQTISGFLLERRDYCCCRWVPRIEEYSG